MAVGTLPALGQVTLPNSIEALPVDAPPRVDGNLEEEVWQQPRRIANFTQRELDEGQPPTEKTEVAIVYTLTTLYIGVWCYDSEPNRITAQEGAASVASLVARRRSGASGARRRPARAARSRRRQAA
ncbi:MAG: hypothetical protein ACE5I1_31595 [bacterium]